MSPNAAITPNPIADLFKGIVSRFMACKNSIDSNASLKTTLKNLREEVILDATKPKKEFPFNKPCIKQQKCIERKF